MTSRVSWGDTLCAMSSAARALASRARSTPAVSDAAAMRSMVAAASSFHERRRDVLAAQEHVAQERVNSGQGFHHTRTLTDGKLALVGVLHLLERGGGEKVLALAQRLLLRLPHVRKRHRHGGHELARGKKDVPRVVAGERVQRLHHEPAHLLARGRAQIVRGTGGRAGDGERHPRLLAGGRTGAHHGLETGRGETTRKGDPAGSARRWWGSMAATLLPHRTNITFSGGSSRS